MSVDLLLIAAAGSLTALGTPDAAQPAAPSEAQREAERAADQAVAEARAEVVAEARAEAAAEAGADPVVAVTNSDVQEGSPVHDPAGGLVGTVESVNENGAVVSTGSARARLPFSSFGRNARGLVISMTRAELETAVASRTR